MRTTQRRPFQRSVERFVIDYERARRELALQDDVLSKLIEEYGEITHTERNDVFESLCRAIVGQQLSVKAARTIYSRFVELVSQVDTEHVLAMTEADARSVGLSRQKYSYLQDLASQTEAGLLESIEQADDEAVIARLTEVKGIGRWTAEMFLMFTLERPDIFAPDDLGLRRAIERQYGVSPDSPLDEYRLIAGTWAPWRTVASLYLWKSLDNTPD